MQGYLEVRHWNTRKAYTAAVNTIIAVDGPKPVFRVCMERPSFLRCVMDTNDGEHNRWNLFRCSWTDDTNLNLYTSKTKPPGTSIR